MSFVLQVIGWILFLYGFFSLIQDIEQEIAVKKLNHNLKIVVLAKNLENNLEDFSKELIDIRRKNGYKNITLIDMESNDVHKIENKLEEDEINMKVLNKEDGEKYIDRLFEL